MLAEPIWLGPYLDMAISFVIERFPGLYLFEDRNIDRAGFFETQGFFWHFHSFAKKLEKRHRNLFMVQKISFEFEKGCFSMVG